MRLQLQAIAYLSTTTRERKCGTNRLPTATLQFFCSTRTTRTPSTCRARGSNLASSALPPSETCGSARTSANTAHVRRNFVQARSPRLHVSTRHPCNTEPLTQQACGARCVHLGCELAFFCYPNTIDICSGPEVIKAAVLLIHTNKCAFQTNGKHSARLFENKPSTRLWTAV